VHMDTDLGEVEQRLKSFLSQLLTECGILERIVYKHKNQHRRCTYFQHVLKVRRDLNLLKSVKLEEILGSSFLVINGNKPKQKVQLLESLKRRRCDGGKFNFLERLLGAARLLSQMVEPLLRAAMYPFSSVTNSNLGGNLLLTIGYTLPHHKILEISTLLAQSFFMKFSLTTLAVLARIRVLVQQVLLDAVLVYNHVSALSQREHTIKLNQEGIEVFREYYPRKVEATLTLECIWQVDKYVLVERIDDNDSKSQEKDGREDVLIQPSDIQYDNIEAFLGADESPTDVELVSAEPSKSNGEEISEDHIAEHVQNDSHSAGSSCTNVVSLQSEASSSAASCGIAPLVMPVKHRIPTKKNVAFVSVNPRKTPATLKLGSGEAMIGGGGEVAPAVAGTPAPIEWKFSQVFGERTVGEEVQEADIISAIEFDKTGGHLATGDRGGRVVLFERTDITEQHGGNRRDLEMRDYPASRHPEFRYRTEFQSHEPEFDYLKSLEIEEKINKIRWCETANGAVFLLSTNDKTIKFWKVQEKKVKKISETNMYPSVAAGNGNAASSSVSSSPKQYLSNGGSPNQPYNTSINNDLPFPPKGISSLRLPVVTSRESSLVARCRRVYAHAHDYHINSISSNSDGETFISADDLRINLWNLEISNQSFNIVDVKPTNMENLTEVITSADFHPSHCNTLAYSSSKGSIRLIDMRQSALCDSHSKIFEEKGAPGSRSFFTEIIASISDIKFLKDGRNILSRDYMTLKLWDINMDSGPVATFQVHEHLRPKLCDLYENDSIFDKFECCPSGDGRRVVTGSYSNLFRVFNRSTASTEATTLEASKNPMRRQIQTPSRPARSIGSTITQAVRPGDSESPRLDANGNSFDFGTKLLHLAWHPSENLIACAAANSLYMYYA
ncbi:serine/threonine protein phosphatase 2A 55 kDa regulatory subunit B beta isoform-like, partial [Dorcoceras hygrometricum]